MNKGYWILRIDVSDSDQFNQYSQAAAIALKKYDAKFIIRAGKSECVEGETRLRNTVIEFPSYQLALDCWKSPEYQAAIDIRKHASIADVVVIEGHDGPQPK
ncbi:MAG: DUF1330 domain-containing protein [Gammaproteobacteria bacterium]|nr:DUF1330 domain-containing protein [Gammaproteobacteria bacterium]